MTKKTCWNAAESFSHQTITRRDCRSGRCLRRRDLSSEGTALQNSGERAGDYFAAPSTVGMIIQLWEHLADKHWANQNISNRNLMAEPICVGGIKFAWACVAQLKRCDMHKLPKLNSKNLLVRLVATVLRETLHHRGIYEETIANACET